MSKYIKIGLAIVVILAISWAGLLSSDMTVHLWGLFELAGKSSIAPN